VYQYHIDGQAFSNPKREIVLLPAAPPIGQQANKPKRTVVAPAIPAGARLRVVGDVHGDATAFAYAAATDRFVVQLGDLVDYGPDSARALRIMFDLIDEGRGLFLLGNHDLKLARVLGGRQVRPDVELERTLTQLDPSLRARVQEEAALAPAWLQRGDALFVHGGFHSRMLEEPAPVIGPDRVEGAVARALYGQPTGRTQPDGYPERSLRWVDRIPAGITVYCGHDRRSRDGRPYVRRGDAGGRAVFLDTGAGKGGHLSWIDIN
jgi:3',5'-cyclic AMP phosphodiesterase CpdA